MTSEALTVLQTFEEALFSGADVRPFFHDDAFYEMSGMPPIGGRFDGPDAIRACFDDRLVGLGPGMAYEEISRIKYAAGNKAIAEIHEKSWLAEAADDVLTVRTCSVAHVVDGKIKSLIDYTDSQAYAAFLERHRNALPKFKDTTP